MISHDSMIDPGALKSHGRLTITIIGLCLFLMACDNELVVNQVHEIPEEEWSGNDTIIFPVQVADTIQPYDLYITMRHTVEYPYMNLFLFAETVTPENKMNRDTIEFILARPDGEWIGEGFGRLRYNRFLIRKALVFPDTGSYRFAFVQAMRTPSLSGIRDLGLQMKKSDQLN